MKDRFREETSRAVLAAAEQVFAEQGLHGASMAQIAERAGVAVGTLYNHFKDREALLQALLHARECELLERVDQQLESASREPFAKQLEGFLRVLFEYKQEHRAFLVLVFEHGGFKMKDVPRAIYQRIELLLKVGHREKALRPDPHHVFATMLLGAQRATHFRDAFGLPQLTPAQAAAALTELFIRGTCR